MFYLDLKINSLNLKECPSADKAMDILDHINQQMIDGGSAIEIKQDVLNVVMEGCVSDSYKIRVWLSELSTYLGDNIVVLINEMRWEMKVTIRPVVKMDELRWVMPHDDHNGSWHPVVESAQSRTV